MSREVHVRIWEGARVRFPRATRLIALCSGTRAEALAIKEELKTLLDTMGLTLSEEKTKLTHITEGFIFLGYKVIREVGTNGRMVPKVLIPDSAITRYRHKVRTMLAPNTYKESVKAKISALNRVTNGWCQYYRVTSYPSIVFHKRGYEIFWDMAHWLGRKWELRMPAVMRKYYDQEGHTFKDGSSVLVLPTAHKAKRLLTKPWHNPYTAKEAIVREKLIVLESLWSGNEHRPGEMDVREETIARKGTICAINGPDCESKGLPLPHGEAVLDHIILRARFKNPKDADRPGNLQIVCTNCHRAKTKTDLKVLSRMR